MFENTFWVKEQCLQTPQTLAEVLSEIDFPPVEIKKEQRIEKIY